MLNGRAYSHEFAVPAQSTETKTQEADALICMGGATAVPQQRYTSPHQSSHGDITNIATIENMGLANLCPKPVMMPMQDQQAIGSDQLDLEMKFERTHMEVAAL